MGRVTGKVALITGGAAGIGQETARTLAREGAQVVIADLIAEGAAQTAHHIGSSATSVFFDATEPESIEAMVQFTVERHGRVDILHNNAALVGPDAWTKDLTVLDTSIDMWDRAFATNVRSIFLACKYAIPHMIEGGGGSIINMASIGGLRGGRALTAYGTTKAAVIGLTRYLAAQHGKQGVRCNAIAPGVIQAQQLLDAVPDLPTRALAHGGHATGRAPLRCGAARPVPRFGRVGVRHGRDLPDRRREHGHLLSAIRGSPGRRCRSGA